jgi:hypothetical protein
MIFNNDGYQCIQGEIRRYVKTYQPTKQKIVTATLQIVQNITARISAHKKTRQPSIARFRYNANKRAYILMLVKYSFSARTSATSPC